MDYEKFYEEHIPKSCLPSDFGGELESVADLHEKHTKELMRLRNYFVAEEKQANLQFDANEKLNLHSELINESDRGIKSLTLSD